MAYNSPFNPDALPAHAEPEQAAQALGALQGVRRPSPNTKVTSQSPLLSQHVAQPPFSGRRPSPSPAAIAAQQSYRPQQGQTQYIPQATYHQQQSNVQPSNRFNSPPPPTDYGQGSRPIIEPGQQRRPSHPLDQYSPRVLQQLDADSSELYQVFQAANISRSGYLTTTELGSALVNADFTPFDSLTIKSLMRMFSTSPQSQPHGPTITASEFQNLWRFLAAWRELFERFDEDHSGRISLAEFSKALVAFGYRLSQPFIGLLYNTYNDRSQKSIDERRGSRGTIQGQGMSFDLFVQACISLKRMTDIFKGYDEDRDGFITLSFEEFLSEILKLRE